MAPRPALIVLSALCATLALSPPILAQPPDGRTSAKAFCTTLQPLVQPLVKPALVLYAANDSSTDELHAGERSYVDCDFRQQSTQLDVGLHDDDGAFDNVPQGYAALAGFGDRARYSVRGAMGMRWVDVVHGKVACEVRFTLADADFDGDWRTAGGKICEAALAARRG